MSRGLRQINPNLQEKENHYRLGLAPVRVGPLWEPAWYYGWAERTYLTPLWGRRLERLLFPNIWDMKGLDSELSFSVWVGDVMEWYRLSFLDVMTSLLYLLGSCSCVARKKNNTRIIRVWMCCPNWILRIANNKRGTTSIGGQVVTCSYPNYVRSIILHVSYSLRPRISVVLVSRETTLTKYILKNIIIYDT